MALVDDDPTERFVVASFDLGFGHPAGEVGLAGVLAFNDNPLTVQSDTRNIPSVFGT